jgi:hypothetical protein
MPRRRRPRGGRRQARGPSPAPRPCAPRRTSSASTHTGRRRRAVWGEEPLGSAMARTSRSLELVVGAAVLGARWRRSGDAATAQRSAYGRRARRQGRGKSMAGGGLRWRSAPEEGGWGACAASSDPVGDVQPAMAGAEGPVVSPELAGPTPSICSMKCQRRCLGGKVTMLGPWSSYSCKQTRSHLSSPLQEQTIKHGIRTIWTGLWPVIARPAGQVSQMHEIKHARSSPWRRRRR